jgi:hypothetical protein
MGSDPDDGCASEIVAVKGGADTGMTFHGEA